jgi:hypothetical protein
MAMFTLPQMISRLTKGFVKFTGRKPDGLEKIKIKQEALERIKQQDKVVDMEGNVIDISKGIMGGRQIKKAMGGRIGLKAGMNRRAFLKLMGGVGAGIGALKTGLLKFAGKGSASKITKDIIKTEAVPGKPEWFDALVTKVINEGTDVTKKLATQERESVHRLNIDKFEDVTVYRNTDTGEIRVSYESPTNVGEESVDLVYKKPLPDEGDPRPSAEFYAVEPEPRVVNMDGDMEFDGENLVNSIDDLMSDTSRLKIIARGDNKPTIKEFVESKRKKDKTKAINEDPVQQAEYIEEKYGPAPDNEPDFASGGVARLLGE